MAKKLKYPKPPMNIKLARRNFITLNSVEIFSALLVGTEAAGEWDIRRAAENAVFAAEVLFEEIYYEEDDGKDEN